MIFSRTKFFLVLFIIISTPFLVHKIIWLARSQKVNGTMSFAGRAYTGQIGHVYSVIWFVAGRDTVWFNGNDNILFKPGETVPVRYQKQHPSDARIDVFPSIWGDTVVYGGIPVAVLLVVFIHPGIVPRRSKIAVSAKRPFVKIV